MSQKEITLHQSIDLQVTQKQGGLLQEGVQADDPQHHLGVRNSIGRLLAAGS